MHDSQDAKAGQGQADQKGKASVSPEPQGGRPLSQSSVSDPSPTAKSSGADAAPAVGADPVLRKADLKVATTATDTSSTAGSETGGSPRIEALHRPDPALKSSAEAAEQVGRAKMGAGSLPERIDSAKEVAASSAGSSSSRTLLQQVCMFVTCSCSIKYAHSSHQTTSCACCSPKMLLCMAKVLMALLLCKFVISVFLEQTRRSKFL